MYLNLIVANVEGNILSINVFILTGFDVANTGKSNRKRSISILQSEIFAYICLVISKQFEIVNSLILKIQIDDLPHFKKFHLFLYLFIESTKWNYINLMLNFLYKSPKEFHNKILWHLALFFVKNMKFSPNLTK
ncbi:hypothetical protein BpHYR1_030953 [Brachionus plicatilis]|uniref:Uncharacterized protein n=1 Tax=Brachionus plicatilis TaxID=10195 RepID=A0A3M7SW51_BRAPC|nr:hypothetical protein BpHYR1_030953 [Brachionus plicatilis]